MKEPLRYGFLVVLLLALTAGSLRAQPVPGVTISPFGSQTVWPVNPSLVTFLDRMQEAGIQWGRSDLLWWGLIESTPGIYNFTRPTVPGYENWDTDRAIRLMRERGIEPFPILCYGNSLYDEGKGPYTDAGRTAYADYCFAAAERYRDSVTYWEIWNEPNLAQFWARDPDPADYARLAAAAAPRIRQANPNARIAGGATSGIDLAFLETAFQNGLLDAVDIITVHPYRIAPPESVNPDLDALRALIARHTARSIAIWTGEWGYNTYWSEIDDIGQAKCLARMMVNNLAHGVSLSIWFSIHAFRETPGNESDPEWGLLDYDLQPRPSFHAMRVVNERLAPPIRKATEPPSITLEPALTDQRVEVFTRADPRHLTLAIWLARWPATEEPIEATTSVRLGVPPSTEVDAYDALDGREVPLAPRRESEGITLENFRVPDYPIYVDIRLPEDNSAHMSLH